MDNLFLSQFCLRDLFVKNDMTRYITSDLFTEKVLSRWDIFNSRDPFTYYD